ncbi:MAG TPA: RDD family protein [Thermomicrobiales bacterium]|nr:RDD family protein [Thermomicrobiales bacterium]
MSDYVTVSQPFPPGSVGPDHDSRGGAILALRASEAYRVVLRRAGALMIDSVIWGIATVGLAISVGTSTEPVVVETANGLALSEQQTFHLSFLQIWSITSLWFAYLIVSESRLGATLGKKAAGIEVVRADGADAGLQAALFRQVPRFVIVSLLLFFSLYPLVPLVFLVEALIARSDDRRRRIGDRLADTVVVRADLLRMPAGHLVDESGALSMGVIPQPIPGQASAAGYRAYAGFWQRTGAVFVDSVVVTSIVFLLPVVPLIPSGFDPSGEFSTASSWLGQTILSLVGFGYFAYLNGRGATLGKMLFGIRVIDATGRPPGLAKGAIRQIIPGAGALVPYVLDIALMIGIEDGFDDGALVAVGISLVVVFAWFLFDFYDGLSMVWNDRRQTIHDRMAGTFVVRKG